MAGRLLAREELEAWGHPNVRALHRTTLEITKDPELTPRGDCIIAVRASKALAEFSEKFKRSARSSSARIVVRLKVGDLEEVIEGRGCELLSFEDPRSIVIRRSDYCCPRTLMIRANKAARDINRELVKLLQDPKTKVKVIIEVYDDP